MLPSLGYGDIYPKSEGGQMFFMFYIAFGVPLFFYLIWFKVRSLILTS